jgi:hypothetical protein
MKFDIHVHTRCSSCSSLSIDEILLEAQSKNLDGVCITDHETMAAGHMLKEGVQSNGLVVIIGMEYTTASGDFLLFGPFEKLLPGLAARELLKTVHHANGVAIAAHPFRKDRPTDENLIFEGHCSIIEGMNGRDNGQSKKMALQWEQEYGIRLVGGSDAHCIEELGKVVTSFHQPIRDRFDLIVELKAGAFSLENRDEAPINPPSPSTLSLWKHTQNM